MSLKFELDGERLSLENVIDIAYNPSFKVTLNKSVYERMQTSRSYIENRMNRGDTMYGVNTGFGSFSEVRIAPQDLRQLQINILRSHACGVGEYFSPQESRAILLLRANALARGHSGVRVNVVEKLLELLNSNVIPVIPQQGSVGASGDLAPLAHLALVLIGEGEVWQNGERVSAQQALKSQQIEPLNLAAKEGLALINGCQVMTGVGLLRIGDARRALKHLDIAGAASLEALRGSRTAFDALIAATRPHPGEARTASNLRRLLGENSEIGMSHAGCNRVQDAYSLRCMPAVHGAAKDVWRHVSGILATEANSSTDNPLVFAAEDKVLSCGNFHGEPVAFALDYLAIAVSAAANMSECRISKLINPHMSGLPAHLAPNGGLNSGLMMIQVAAASLVSENKIYAHPASVDSIPTNVDKEDHVSMGTIAARKLGKIIDNAEKIIAMELLAATQALDFLRPLQSSDAIEILYKSLRLEVPFAAEDRVLSMDVQRILEHMRRETWLKGIEQHIGELEC